MWVAAQADDDDEDWDEEQNLVARLVHHLACPETDGQYRMLVAVRKHFGQGGPRRLPHTLPPLVFNGLQLVRQLQAQSDVEGFDVALKKLFQFLYQTVQALAEVPKAESALRLYLQCAQAASSCGLETVAYEFCERAFEIFEESIPDTKAQVVALQLIVGSLHRCVVFGTENRETLVHKATSYSSKLLKKPDQCRAVGLCSHLFHHETAPALCDPTSLVACLKRSLKNANAAQQAAGARGESGSVALFVDILNLYLYFFDKGVDAIDAASIQARQRRRPAAACALCRRLLPCDDTPGTGRVECASRVSANERCRLLLCILPQGILDLISGEVSGESGGLQGVEGASDLPSRSFLQGGEKIACSCP